MKDSVNFKQRAFCIKKGAVVAVEGLQCSDGIFLVRFLSGDVWVSQMTEKVLKATLTDETMEWVWL